jgi:transposase
MGGCEVHWGMRPPVFVRPLTDPEHLALEEGLRSPDAFTFRRSQILLASAQARIPPEIGDSFGCCEQTVRNIVHAFNQRGLSALRRESSRPKIVQRIFDEPHTLALRDLLHRSPRDFDQPTSGWTLELAAQVCYREGLTDYVVSYETVRQALLRLGVRWRRAKHWITSPDPEYAKKNIAATG